MYLFVHHAPRHLPYVAASRVSAGIQYESCCHDVDASIVMWSPHNPPAVDCCPLRRRLPYLCTFVPLYQWGSNGVRKPLYLRIVTHLRRLNLTQYLTASSIEVESARHRSSVQDCASHSRCSPRPRPCVTGTAEQGWALVPSGPPPNPFGRGATSPSCAHLDAPARANPERLV